MSAKTFCYHLQSVRCCRIPSGPGWGQGPDRHWASGHCFVCPRAHSDIVCLALCVVSGRRWRAFDACTLVDQEKLSRDSYAIRRLPLRHRKHYGLQSLRPLSDINAVFHFI